MGTWVFERSGKGKKAMQMPGLREVGGRHGLEKGTVYAVLGPGLIDLPNERYCVVEYPQHFKSWDGVAGLMGQPRTGISTCQWWIFNARCAGSWELRAACRWVELI